MAKYTLISLFLFNHDLLISITNLRTVVPSLLQHVRILSMKNYTALTEKQFGILSTTENVNTNTHYLIIC